MTNGKAMREALELAAQALPFTVLTHIDGMPIGEVIDKVDAALAKPPRNCDVGTPEEQEKRYEKFCDSHKWVDDDGLYTCSSQCPLYKKLDCAVHWEQMPYEAEQKGEADGR